MCGICGIVDLTGNPDARAVEAMTQALLHRGPDTGGIHEYPGLRFRAQASLNFGPLRIRQTADDFAGRHDGPSVQRGNI